MVAVKGKLTSLSIQPIQQNKPIKTAIGAPPFKIYAEPDRPKTRNPDSNNPERLKSVPLNSRRCQNDENTVKGHVKNSEKIKVKLDSSTSVKVVTIQRKVLADISNVQGSFTKPKTQDKSKSLCVSTKLAADTRPASSSSRKPLTENLRRNLTEATGNNLTSKKPCKDVKAAVNDLRSNTQGRKLVSATISRTSGATHLPPKRTSLPAPRQVKKANASGIKEQSTEGSERSRGKSGFPVKPKVGMSVASQISHSRSHLWKNRVSDGYIIMASKGQSNMDGGALSRRSIKPSVKTKTTVINNARTSKSKSYSGSNKLAANTISSKIKENMEKSSSSKHDVSSVIKEPKEVGSFNKRDTATTSVDAVAKRKSGRRKSFTSLLVSKSKEDLPNIYDDRNHLEVSEYVDDIYQYYWVMEAQKQPLKNYMEIQTEITPQMRGILINWLIEVHTKFELMQETLFLMVKLLDQYLSLVSIKKSEMQLVGLTALLLASKYEDFWHPKILDLISVSAESYTRAQMLQMESAFLRTLKFRLNAPTPYVFMLRFLKAAQSGKKALNYKPSLLCASAIYLARCTMRMAQAWTPLLEKHSHYEESQIRHCAQMILNFQKAAKTALVKVSYEKYMKLEFSRVAAITPLEMLL